MAVKPIPEGYHSVTPYLIVDDAARALEFYKKALGAIELMRMPAPGGRIGHAEIRIGDSPIRMPATKAPSTVCTPSSWVTSAIVPIMMSITVITANSLRR